MLNDSLPPNFDKEYLLNKFLEIIYAFSSKEYQRRIWIDALGPEEDDFDETYMSLEDCNYYIIKFPKEFGLTKKQKEMIIEFRRELESFSDDNNWPPFFIDTPEWTRITEMAKEVLRAFNYKKQ